MAGAIAIPLGEFVGGLALLAILVVIAIFLGHFLWWLGTQLPLLGDVLQGLFGWVVDTARGIANSLLGGFSGRVAATISVFAARIQAVSEQLALAAIVIAQQQVNRFHYTLSYANALVNAAVWNLSQTINWVYSSLIGLINSVYWSLRAYIDAVQGYLNELINSVYWSLRAYIDAVQGYLTALIYNVANSLRAYIDAWVGWLRAVIDAIAAQIMAQVIALHNAAIAYSRTYTDARITELTDYINTALNREIELRKESDMALEYAISAVARAFSDYLDRCGNPLCNAYRPLVDSLLELEDMASLGLILEFLFSLNGRSSDNVNAVIELATALFNDMNSQIPKP